MGAEYRIALMQLSSEPHWDTNLHRIREHCASLAGNCDLVVLPENAFCLGSGETVRRQAHDQAVAVAQIGELAAAAQAPVLAGGVAIRKGSKISNASLTVDPNGMLLARYDKVHLFQLHPGTPNEIDETKIYCAGNAPVTFSVAGWTIGVSICYDLRFPELFRAMGPVDIGICTAAFTDATGKAHWETLLRARAIENLCYMVGVGQCGTNPDTGVRLHGHSVVVDPWGAVVDRLSAQREDIRIATLHADRIRVSRDQLPALDNRRLPPGRTSCNPVPGDSRPS